MDAVVCERGSRYVGAEEDSTPHCTVLIRIEISISLYKGKEIGYKD